MIINQINPNNTECAYCLHRRKEHLKNIDYIKNVFPGHHISTVEAFDKEIRGIEMLKKFGQKIFN